MIKDVLLWVGGSIAAILLFVRGIFLRRIRLGTRQTSALLDVLRKHGRYFVLSGEDLQDDKIPAEFAAICHMGRMSFYLTVEERILQAGFTGTDTVVRVAIPRWQLKRFLATVSAAQAGLNQEVPVYVLAPWDAERVGTLRCDVEIPVPMMNPEVYEDMEEGVGRVLAGAQAKVGLLLHGDPGNGKSYFVRYLAMKYRLPVYIMLLAADMDNRSIVRMFAHAKGPCLILFEDFDAYFDGRTCQIADAKFTLDGLLNVLDGLYSTPDRVVFVMTANHLDRVDDALKARPSRFQFVREIAPPTAAERGRLFAGLDGVDEYVRRTAGMSLDAVLREREQAGRVRKVKDCEEPAA